MGNIIAGVIAITIAILYLGGMVLGIGVALGVRVTPLAVIVAIAVLFLVIDFVESIREQNRRKESQQNVP